MLGTSSTMASSPTTSTHRLALWNHRTVVVNQLLELSSSNPSSHQKGIFHVSRCEANDLIRLARGL